MGLDPASGKPLKEVHQLGLGEGYRRTWIENTHPDLFQVLQLNGIVLQEALYAHVQIEADASVLVLVVDAESEYDPLHDVVELVPPDVRIFEKAGEGDLVVGLHVLQHVRQFEHLLLGQLNLPLSRVNLLLDLGDLVLELLYLHLDEGGELGVQLVYALAVEIILPMPLLYLGIAHHFLCGNR